MPHFLTPLLNAPNRAHVLRNARTGAIVADRIVTAFDSRTRRQGLLGRDGWPAGDALIIAPCSIVHTAFMRFPIDAIFVRRDGRVARTAAGVRPWRVRGSLAAFAVVEMRAGTLGGLEIARDDVLEVVGSEGLHRVPEAQLSPDISLGGGEQRATLTEISTSA